MNSLTTRSRLLRAQLLLPLAICYCISARSEAAATLQLARDLISRPSVTPRDEGCIDLIKAHLDPLTFESEVIKLGEVTNLWSHYGKDGPLLVFAGHIDVVPTGPSELWRIPPFEPTIVDGMLYGRGAADMKGPLAAMVIAASNFIKAHPHFPGQIAFLITSNEEGYRGDPGKENGTKGVLTHLRAKGVKIDYAIVGEPTSDEELGDNVKHGRRGSLSGHLMIRGRQGHVAYPDKADNPIHKAFKALDELVSTVWDEGSVNFQPTTLQISNIHAGTGSGNVIPGHLEVDFNLRFGTASAPSQLKDKIESIFRSHGLDYDMNWALTAAPFLTAEGRLVPIAVEAIRELTGIVPRCTTDGGTSDARFLAGHGIEVLEFGPVNATIHGINEHVSVQDLMTSTRIYERILEKIFL